MSSRDPILTKVRRRRIFWVLLGLAISAPTGFTTMLFSQSGVFFGLDGFELLQISAAAHALLLVWCALFIGVEPVLARCALIYIALLHVLFFAGLTQPVF